MRKRLSRVMGLGWAGVLLLVWMVSAGAGELDGLCPAEALLYVESCPLGELRTQIDAFGSRASPMFYPAMISMQISSFLAGPLGQTIDLARPVAFFAVASGAGEGDKEGAVLLVPVKDYTAFEKALRQERPNTHAKPVRNYAAVSEEPEALALVGKGPAWSVQTRIKGDVRAAVNLPRIKGLLKPQVEQIGALIQVGAAMGAGGGSQLIDPAALVGVYLDALKRLGRQVSRIEVGLDFDAQGLGLHWVMDPVEGTTLARFCREQPAGLGTFSEALPPGGAAYAMGGLRWKELGGALGTAAGRLTAASKVKGELDFIHRFVQLCSAGGVDGSFAQSVFPGGKGSIEMVEIFEVSDGVAVRNSFREMAQGYARLVQGLSQNQLKLETTFHPAAFEHKGTAIDLITVKMDLSGMAPQQAAVYEEMWGAEGIRASFAFRGRTGVITAGKDFEQTMRRTLDRLEGGLQQPLPGWVEAVRKGFPQETNVACCLSLFEYLKMYGGAFSKAMGSEENLFALLSQLPIGDTGVGAYAAFPQGRLQMGLFVPSDTVAQMHTVGMTLATQIPQMMQKAVQEQQEGEGGGAQAPPRRYQEEDWH
jgi:hypothetical protein